MASGETPKTMDIWNVETDRTLYDSLHQEAECKVAKNLIAWWCVNKVINLILLLFQEALQCTPEACAGASMTLYAKARRLTLDETTRKAKDFMKQFYCNEVKR